MAYDPIDTIRWMLDEARAQLSIDTVAGAGGRPKKKTKAQMTAERVRFETLCEVLWNVAGRPIDFADFTDARLAA